MKPIVKAALDLSGTEAAFALEIDGKLVRTVFRPMPRRESAQLPGWVLRELAAAGVALDDVGFWTSGSGPGSFTGLRLAAALIEGWSFGREVRTRCVPGALALAEVLKLNEGETGGVLYDGRNCEALIFEVILEHGVLRPSGEGAILSAAECAGRFERPDSRKLCALASDVPALEKLCGAGLTDKVKIVEHLPIAALLRDEYGKYDGNLTQMVYIRPSVAPRA